MIKLNHTALHKMKLHAAQMYPEECCGVLFGKDRGDFKDVCDILEMNNTQQEQRERRYLISPEDYKAAETEAKEEGVEIIGLYHSHPNHPSGPSPFDLEHALPYWSYVIVSVDKGYPTELASWVLKDDRSAFDEELVQIVDGQFVHHSK